MVLGFALIRLLYSFSDVATLAPRESQNYIFGEMSVSCREKHGKATCSKSQMTTDCPRIPDASRTRLL